MLNERSRRVSDLFVEGTECLLGQDGDGKDVVVWINKVNSFESEDARRDGAVERGRRIAQLSRPDDPEYIGLLAQVKIWDAERLARNRVDNQQINDLSLEALNDVEIEHKELMERIRRGPELLDDAGVAMDDPKRTGLADDQAEYFKVLRETQARLRDDALKRALETPRADLEAEYIEAWREREALEGFLEQRRITELYFAMRDCHATTYQDGEVMKFDHSRCDHNHRLLHSRAEVRDLPEAALDRVMAIMDDLPVPPRDAGNSAAPESSSVSSEQPNEEEDSTPSTPEETPLAVPTT